MCPSSRWTRACLRYLPVPVEASLLTRYHVTCVIVQVKSTNGDTFLGGEDFDNAVLDHLISEFKKSNGIDLSQDALALQRLREAAETAKIELSSTVQSQISLPFITADATGPKHLNLTMSRAQYEKLVGDLIDRTVGPCKTSLQDAGLTTSVSNVVTLFQIPVLCLTRSVFCRILTRLFWWGE